MFNKLIIVFSAPDFSGMDFDYEAAFEAQRNPKANYTVNYNSEYGFYEIFEIIKIK